MRGRIPSLFTCATSASLNAIGTSSACITAPASVAMARFRTSRLILLRRTALRARLFSNQTRPAIQPPISATRTNVGIGFIASNPVKAAQNIFGAVTQRNRPPVGAGHWILALRQRLQQPLDFRRLEFHVHLDGGPAGDRGRNIPPDFIE